MSQIPRRHFLTACGALLAPLLAYAQASNRLPRIVYLLVAPLSTATSLTTAFEQGLRDHGLIPGKDVLLEYRSADGRVEHFAEIVRSVVESRPDVIVTSANQTTLVVKAATQTIPIVMMLGTSVVKVGLVASLALPGGNVTGMTWDVGPEVVAKRLELLKLAVPAARRLAIIWDPPYGIELVPMSEAAGKALGWTVISREAGDDFNALFEFLAGERIDAVSVHPTGRLFGRRAEFIALATKHRIASAFSAFEFVASGGLLAYGASLPDLYRRGTDHVSKILKGAKPGDLPVQQPIKLELVVNIKTAKALGLSLPNEILLRADRLIE